MEKGPSLTYNLESVCDNADSHQLLSVVSTLHHQCVGETLDDGALGLSEPLDGISASRVGDVDGRADLNVITVQPIVSPGSVQSCVPC